MSELKIPNLAGIITKADIDTKGTGFTERQVAALSAPLNRANVKQRKQGRACVSYLEGWQVIAEANRIFGFDGWQRQTIAVRCVAQAERLIGLDQKPGWGVTYTANVRVTVTAGGLVPLIREGSGAGHGIDVDLGQAHESALKEAETDAMKRALMTFGNPFGLALYDKQQRQVSSSAAATTEPVAAPAAAPEAPAAAPEAPAAEAQDQPISEDERQLCIQLLKDLKPTERNQLIVAFKAHFSLPDDALITQYITTAAARDFIQQQLTAA